MDAMRRLRDERGVALPMAMMTTTPALMNRTATNMSALTLAKVIPSYSPSAQCRSVCHEVCP